VIEAAFVFDKEGKVIHWHEPPGRSGGSLPDSANLWNVLWENRHRLGGVAHSHPWNGSTSPSPTDRTTFAAVEAGLGTRLIWPIVSMTHVYIFGWAPFPNVQPADGGYCVYQDSNFMQTEQWQNNIEQLRRRSRGE
jgi:hypothetical protein